MIPWAELFPKKKSLVYNPSMANTEKVLTSQPYLPFPPYTYRSKESAVEEISKPCGRFRSPLTLEESVRLFTTKQFGNTDMLASATYVIAPGTPLNWQVILRYLHREHVIHEPRFTHRPFRNDLPKAFGFELAAVWDRKLTDGLEVNATGYASSMSVDRSMAKVIGEILERYVLTLYKCSTLIRASQREIQRARARALPIEALSAFLPSQQARNRRFARDIDTPFHWVRGEMLDGRKTLIPAQLIFWNYDLKKDAEEGILGESSTSGAAGHFTREEAVLAGLLEGIERDGFLIYWLNHLSPRRIDVAQIYDKEVCDFLAIIKRYGLDIYFLDTTSDVNIPSVTCVIVDGRTDVPIITLGGAAGFDLTSTILRSGYEALNIFQFSEGHPGFVLPEDYEPFTDARIGHQERVATWRGRHMLERLQFFLSGTPISPSDFLRSTERILSVNERLDHVVRSLDKLGAGYEIYLYEASHDVLRALGYHVVRVVVPALIPLYLRETRATLHAPRLKSVPPKLGYRAADTPNPWPHPFP